MGDLARLLSLSMFSRFIQVVAWVTAPFLYMAGYYPTVLLDLWLVSTFWWLSMVLRYTYTYKFLFLHLFSILWGTYRGGISGSYENSMFSFLRKGSFLIFIYLFGCVRSQMQHSRSLIFVGVCGIFSCSRGDLVPWPGIKPRPPALEAQNLNHWNTREVLTRDDFERYIYFLVRHNQNTIISTCDRYDSHSNLSWSFFILSFWNPGDAFHSDHISIQISTF